MAGLGHVQGSWRQLLSEAHCTIKRTKYMKKYAGHPYGPTSLSRASSQECKPTSQMLHLALGGSKLRGEGSQDLHHVALAGRAGRALAKVQ